MIPIFYFAHWKHSSGICDLDTGKWVGLVLMLIVCEGIYKGI